MADFTIPALESFILRRWTAWPSVILDTDGAIILDTNSGWINDTEHPEGVPVNIPGQQALNVPGPITFTAQKQKAFVLPLVED